jgi:hypothetical protein
MEDKIISEKYLTEIAFTRIYDPLDIYYVLFWMVDDYVKTAKRVKVHSLSRVVNFVSLQNGKEEAILKRLQEKPSNIFYAHDIHKDSHDLTIILVGKDPSNIIKMSTELNSMYENGDPAFYKILKIEGLRVK